MKLYNAKKSKRSTKERVGFYTALSICLAAVGMAAYSTYTNLSAGSTVDTVETVAVDKIVTGVTATEETKAAKSSETTAETTTAATEKEKTETRYVEETEPSETKSALETMLTVKTNLVYPVDNAKVTKQYTEETVYNKSLNEWEAHTGVDFACKEGDSVYAMGDGEVVKVYDDDFMGKTMVVKSSNYTTYYSGLKDVLYGTGDRVNQSDTIATAENVPAEYLDENHIHIAIKVDGQYVDPMSLIGSDE